MQLAFIIALFVVCDGQRQTDHESFSVQPEDMNATYGSEVVFMCTRRLFTNNDFFRLEWVLIDATGSKYSRDDKDRLGIDFDSNGLNHFMSVPVERNGIGNGTSVQCEIIYNDQNTALSPMGRLLIQGPLDAVDNLSYQILIPGLSVNLTWTAPFTLDLTGIDPDITYCINITLSDNSTLATNSDICGYESVSYTLNFTSGEISPCDSLQATVTPYSGTDLNNFGMANEITVHLYEGIDDFQTSEVRVTTLEEDSDCLQINLMLQIAQLICSNHCSATFSSSLDNTSKTLNEDNGLTCNPNNSITVYASSTTTPLRRKRFYDITRIIVGNSNGNGTSTGTQTISTHPIQSVTVTPELEATIVFADNTSAKGAQIVLSSQTFNETTCIRQFRENLFLPSSSNTINEQLRPQLSGEFSVNVFVLESDGYPDQQAVPANQPIQVTVEETMDEPPQVDNVVSWEYFSKTELIISYNPPSADTRPNTEYIGLLTEESKESYTVLTLPFSQNTQQVPVNESKRYCLALFEFTDGRISPTAVTNTFIDPNIKPEKPEKPEKPYVTAIWILFGIFLFVVAASLLVSMTGYCIYTFKRHWYQQWVVVKPKPTGTDPPPPQTPANEFRNLIYQQPQTTT